MSIKYLRLLLWLIFSISNCKSKVYRKSITKWTPKNHRLWGGEESKSHKYGWEVRIASADGAFRCGGAYIGPLLVVTSAQCIEPFRYALDQVSVESMAYINSDSDQYVSIDTVYTTEGHEDIALMRLKSPIRGKLVQFIKLCQKKLFDGMELRVIGYINSKIQPTGGASYSKILVKSRKNCSIEFGISDDQLKTSFCALHSKKQKNCAYEGGSPLVWKNQLCGLVSWGPWCSNNYSPDIYTDINLVKEFINLTEKDIATGILA